MENNKTIKVNELVYKEFEYMLALHKKVDSYTRFETVNDLFNYVLASIADGSRRPGSWERDLLIPMGLVAETEEHYVYRSSYGDPDKN